MLKQSSTIVADNDEADDTSVTMTTDTPSAVPDIENLMSVCQLALDEEIRKMNEVFVSIGVFICVSVCLCLLLFCCLLQ